MVLRRPAFVGCLLVVAAVALLLSAVALADAPVATTVTLPGSDYTWAQPGTAARPNPYAQPPAWIPITFELPPLPTTSYTWAQPGTAPTPDPYAQPPAWIPTG
jgi:hypothetical protein